MMKKYIIIIIVLLIGGGLGNVLRYYEQKPDKKANLAVLPDQIEGYFGFEKTIDSLSLEVLNADATSLKMFRGPDGYEYDLFIGYFDAQHFGEGIHSPKHCLPGGGWKIQSHDAMFVNFDPQTVKEVNSLQIGYQNKKSIMLYWFETRSGSTRSEYGLKFDLFKNALFFQPTDAAFIRVTVAVPDGNIQKATEKGIQFARSLLPYIKQSLPFNI